MDVVTSIPAPRGTPTVSLDWSPHDGAYTYTVGVTLYSPTNAFYAQVNTSLTFTATISFPDSSQWAVTYEWDFGDGVKGYGNPATHSYKFASLHTQVVVKVTDNFDKIYTARKQVYLH